MNQRTSRPAYAQHPVPGGACLAASSPETKRGLVFSALLHLTLALIGWLVINAKRAPTDASGARLYDIEFIPLSALETHLPKGIASRAPSIRTDAAQTAPRLREAKPPPSHSHNTAAVKAPPVAASPALAAPQSSVIGAPDGDARSGEQARINYQDMIASLLARAKRYPERAIRRRMTGDATIRIEISSDGTLSEFAILQSTDSPILDEELKAMVDRAAPFPAFPKDLRRESLALVVPITFRLDS